jgi:DNA-binding response OmpR family regulator
MILLAMEIICRNLYFSFGNGLGYFRVQDSAGSPEARWGVHPNSSGLQFGEFELDVRNHRLQRSGTELKLERIPMELLILLASRPGELVRRKEIIQELWGDGINVDTENAINAAVRKIRQALGDDSSSPRFIQTISK